MGKKRIKHEIITDGDIQTTTLPHPDEGKYDKTWIAELFVSEFDNAFIISVDNTKNEIFKISIENTVYNFYFDTTDTGGKENSRKISIPYSAKPFREVIQNGENVYVVNLYRQLNSDWEAINENKIWLLVDPLQIYSSKVLERETWNDSSRWMKTKDILSCMRSGRITTNSKKNVYASGKDSLLELLSDSKLRSKYYLMNELSESAKMYIEKDDSVEDYSRIRNEFRKLLLNENENNQINSKVINPSLLVASHIWGVSLIKNDSTLSNQEKVEKIGDPNNGLLIPVGLDKLFDKYLITFNDNWEIICSKEVTKEEIEEITGRKIEGRWIRGKGKESLKYLEIHRKVAFSKWNY